MSQPLLSAPICAPGTSRVVAGFDPTQILLGDAIGDALVALGMGELAAVFASVGVLQFALDVVCSQDPPPVPTIDAARLKAYYDTQSSQAYPLVLQDAQNLVGHYLWFQWCECVGVATPAPPAPVPLPPGVNLDRSPVGAAPTSTCYGRISTFQTATTDVNGDITWPFTVPATNVVGAATQWFSVQQQNSTGTFVPPVGVVNFVDQLDATGASLQTDSWTYTPLPRTTADVTHTILRAPGATQLRHRSHFPGGAVHAETSFFADQICSSVPPQLRPDCCPPDPELENLIVQVLRLEQLILQSLGGSHSYTRSTSHTGLSGTTSIPVLNLRGIAVDVTQGTPTTKQQPGNPPYEWDLGWLSVSNGDGMLQEQRLTRQHLVWLPPAMDLATSIGYFLNPGVVATITELVPA